MGVKAVVAKMPTVLLISTVHGQGFGAETVLENLLLGWNERRCGLAVMTPQKSKAGLAAGRAGIPVIPLATHRDAFVWNVVQVQRRISDVADISVVHAWHGRGFELAAMLGRTLQVPAVGTLHDHPQASFHGRIRRWLMKKAAGHFHELICVSQSVADACANDQYRVRLSVVRNGLGDDACLPRVASSRLRVGFLGMYAAWKGFCTVFDWAVHLGKSNLDIEWRLYGDTASELKGLSQRMAAQVRHPVLFLGRLDPKRIFAEIDILVCPSVQFDPLPTVLIEAARAGVPCVASDMGGAREIVVSEKSGFLFDPLDPNQGLACLRRLLNDGQLRINMGAFAREHFKRAFAVDRMIREYCDVWSLCQARACSLTRSSDATL